VTVASLAALLVASPAVAEDKSPDGIPSPSIATSLPFNGDPTGLRRWLATHGITYGLSYTSEVLGNPSGGVRQGGLYESKLEGFVAADLEKLVGRNGLSFFTNAFQIHRTSGPRDQHFESLITISNIEATPSTRLSELWLEQKLFNDRFSVRAGQLAADAEFFISDYSKMFISSDWPTITGANLPSGGPAYPLATPGVRLKFYPTDNWTALLVVFNGDPGDQATVNRHGTNFRMSDPPLLMGEIQHRYNQATDAKDLAGILRLGTWHHFGKFEDQRLDDTGVSMASPLSSGTARLLRGTSGIYGIIDQQIYRPVGDGPDSGASVFGRIAATPSDRNLVDFYLDGGIVLSGMLPSRPDDKLGASFIYSHISDRSRALDRDAVAFSGVD
jgi:porin